ncbi:MAG: hypothetical protein H7837_07130 [Magnetococcus sp. MYC-9]
MPKKIPLVLLCILFGGMRVPAGWADATSPTWEIHGVAKNETAWFTRPAPSGSWAAHSSERRGGDLLKFENSLNLFVNRPFTEQTSLHAQLNLVSDGAGQEGDQGHLAYSQNDYLRELYLDTTLGPWDVRLGKQQEVWGTTDGIKLLDILNPTDYREFTQNTMADARIPVWMLKSSLPMAGRGNLQFLLAEHRENKIPGLEANGDPDAAFVMKGMDAITGQTRGFLHLTPALGKVAGTFDTMAKGFGMSGLRGVPGAETTTVEDFVRGGTPLNGACPGLSGAVCLHQITRTTDQDRTALMNGDHWNSNTPRSAFEYMNQATFATFGSFVGAQSAYRRDYPEDWALNVGVRYKHSIGGNFNYSLNYLNHYDPNPYVALSWEDGRGNPLHINRTTNSGQTTLQLHTAAGVNQAGPATLVFTEKVQRINSLGGSFDTSMESGWLGPVVLRGEAVYQTGTRTPVVDRALLAQGDLAGALQNKATDQFNYVLGAEFIAFTNWTIGGQFIQFILLDPVDEVGRGGANSGRYSADPAVMSLDNGLRKASQYKEFASLLLSKPIGTEQQGRLNNLTLGEERGGWWNRLDGEWKWNDHWLGTAEWNHYWGNENTQFGQFAGMSNVQIGMKYLF